MTIVNNTHCSECGDYLFTPPQSYHSRLCEMCLLRGAISLGKTLKKDTSTLEEVLMKLEKEKLNG